MGDNAPYFGVSTAASGANRPPGFAPAPGAVGGADGSGPSGPAHHSRRWFLVGGAALAVGAATGVGAALLRKSPEMPATIVLAGGVKGATYLQVGADISEAIEAIAPGTHVDLKETGAAVDNLRMLNSGAVDFGFAALDAAAVDTGVLTRELTGIARVYDSLIQLVVPADSPITSLLDLEGRAVSVGTNGSGSEFTTTSMLTTAGITPKKIEHFGQNPAVAALKSGELDAFFSVTGSPTPSIAKLAKEMAIRLIPLGEYYPMLERAIPHVYTYDTIAAGAYQGVAETPTVRVPNALLVRQGLEDHVVAKVTEAVLSDSSRQYWKHEVSKNIDRKLAAVLGSVQMHPAARAWLDSN